MFSFDFNKFYSGLIEREYVLDDYLNRYPKGRKIYKKQVQDLFEKSFDNKDSVGLRATTTVADLDGIDLDYTVILIKLLKENWHQSHEDIIMLLDEIKDPKSVNSIYETSLTIPDYDDCRSLAKKCIWALGSINTFESKQKLKILSTSKDQIIKEAALIQLKQMAS